MLTETSNEQSILSVNLGAIKVVQEGTPFQEFPLHKVYYPDSIIRTLIIIRDLYREQLNVLILLQGKKSENAVLQRSCIDIVGLMPSFLDSLSNLSLNKSQELIMEMIIRFEDPFIVNKTGEFELKFDPASDMSIYGFKVHQSKFTFSGKEHSHFILEGESDSNEGKLLMIKDEKSGVVYACVDRIYLNDNDERGYSLGHRFFTPCVKTKNLGAYGGVVRSEIVLDSN